MKKHVIPVLITLAAAFFALTMNAFAGLSRHPSEPLDQTSEPFAIAPGYYLVQITGEYPDEARNETTTFSYKFDENGNLINCLETDSSLQVKHSYKYDENNNMVSDVVVYGEGDFTSESTWSYTYDDQHRMLTADNGGIYYRYSYDISGNLIRRDMYLNSQAWTNIYAYDENGTLLSISTFDYYDDPDISLCYFIYEFTYDDSGNLKQRVTYQSSSGDGFFVSDTSVYEFDANGNNTKITTYDKNGFLQDIHEYVYEKLGPDPIEPEPSVSFTDVKPGAYYEPAVNWAVANNITSGTSPTTFSPDATCTRGQVVAFLWRAAGRPEPETTKNPFTDVKSTDYFYKAVLWASENGIVYGTSGTTFSPNQGCTRGQVAAFLWRAAGRPEPTTGNNPFTDVKPSEYYSKAVVWAAENKIVYGTSATQFSPNASCTRAQIVTFLYRTYAPK